MWCLDYILFTNNTCHSSNITNNFRNNAESRANYCWGQQGDWTGQRRHGEGNREQECCWRCNECTCWHSSSTGAIWREKIQEEWRSNHEQCWSSANLLRVHRHLQQLPGHAGGSLGRQDCGDDAAGDHPPPHHHHLPLLRGGEAERAGEHGQQGGDCRG